MTLTFTGPEAEQLADRIEANASRDLYDAAPPTVRARSLDIGSAVALIVPTLPVTYFNRVIGLGGKTPATASEIESIVAAYTAAGVPDFWIHANPHAQPAPLATLLAERGFTPAARRSWAKFLRGVEPATERATQLKVREATAVDANAVAAVVCSAYGMPLAVAPWFAALIGRPRWHVWLAQQDDKVVGTGSFFVDGETAWLGIGATLAEHRGHGAQSALLAARIHAAARAGCRVLATETGEPVGTEANPSLANIRRAGFVQVSSRVNYQSARPAASV